MDPDSIVRIDVGEPEGPIRPGDEHGGDRQLVMGFPRSSLEVDAKPGEILSGLLVDRERDAERTGRGHFLVGEDGVSPSRLVHLVHHFRDFVRLVGGEGDDFVTE